MPGAPTRACGTRTAAISHALCSGHARAVCRALSRSSANCSIAPSAPHPRSWGSSATPGSSAPHRRARHARPPRPAADSGRRLRLARGHRRSDSSRTGRGQEWLQRSLAAADTATSGLLILTKSGTHVMSASTVATQCSCGSRPRGRFTWAPTIWRRCSLTSPRKEQAASPPFSPTWTTRSEILHFGVAVDKTPYYQATYDAMNRHRPVSAVEAKGQMTYECSVREATCWCRYIADHMFRERC